MWVPGASQMPPSTKLSIEIILALLCQGGLCQAPVYQIQVPSRVTAQQGLCVLLPCHFTANVESSGVPYKYWFLRNDDRDTSLAMATTDPGRALREPGGRIHLVGDTPDNCSLHISDVRAGDRDHYYLRFVKGDFKYSYMVTQPLVDVTDRAAGIPSGPDGAKGPEMGRTVTPPSSLSLWRPPTHRQIAG